MPPAARLADVTAHGTPLTGGGSPNVFIGGMPAYRAGLDHHSCPLVTGTVPHVGGIVTVGSATVLINGAPAVRQGDTIVENGPPNTVAMGEPTVLIDAGTTAAEPNWTTSMYEDLAGFVERFNGDVAGRDLGFIGERVGDERVNLFVTTDSGEAAFSFRTTEAPRIEGFERGSRDDATVRMETDRATVDRLVDADAPVAAFRDAMASGAITITGIGPLDWLEWRLLGVARDAARLLGVGG